jgi:dTMP kinase
LQEVIRPALAKGEIVVSDRYNDASFAYQGYGRELGVELVRAFDRIVCARTQPDLTIVFDLPPRLALGRAQGRQSRRKAKLARFELQGANFQKKVRDGYLAIARKEPRRVKVVQAGGPVAEVHADIRKVVDAFLAQRLKRF